MHTLRGILGFLALLALVPGAARAGLYYSGEQQAELPSQWRGFLLDQRSLRTLGVPPPKGQPPSPLQTRYAEAVFELEKAVRQRELTADEQADFGALYVRLGKFEKALEVLRAAQQAHPNHFRIAANLGTAWQMAGDLARAAEALRQAVRLAPGKLQRAEEFHLKLVQLRQRSNDPQQLDDLFGVRYPGEPRKLPEAEAKKLPADAVAVLQQLALWLPADGRLLWQLAELANVHGDVRTAAAILDGCVSEFAMHSPELRRHRQSLRAAADATPTGPGTGRVEHEGHVGMLRTRSSRPLVSRVERDRLPEIRPDGVNPLPWAVIVETALDRQYRPTFHKYLKELDGKKVSLTGFMQPINDELECSAFLLLEYPVGCWYCEMPEVTSLMLIELPPGKSKTFTRNLIKVTGRLQLNSTDPENFLYVLRDAVISAAD